ncbi:hypothetical protein PILCRDRAFT_16065 [Piloderma croceum F 1598]|uniref:Uncharacterized protein n=1 Tax=Piloderma croceum (strain F 1598) TaxID=765440 RepID=A0A0C3AFE1_PILCF|nr:hypothetical protein PILCRDRAFT_16065 [Piloderma croceum F 1598]
MVNPESPDPAWDFDPSMWKIPANLLITVPEHDASASNQERASREARNVGYPIWKAALASASVLQKIVSAVIYLFLAILQVLVNWLEYASHKIETKHEIKGQLKEIQSPKSSISQLSESAATPVMSYPPSGRIINTTIREDDSGGSGAKYLIIDVPGLTTRELSDRTQPPNFVRHNSDPPNVMRDSEVLSLFVGLPDQENLAATNAQTYVGRTSSAGIPIDDNSLAYSPTLSEAEEPLAFVTILREPINRSFGSGPVPSGDPRASLPSDSLAAIQASIQDIEARLEQIKASNRANGEPIVLDIEDLPHAYGRNHTFHTCDDRLGKKARISPDEPVVHRSRTARRKERQRRQETERKKRERSVPESAEDEETTKRIDDEEQKEVDRLVCDVRASLGEPVRTVKKPFTSVEELEHDLVDKNICSIRRAPTRREDHLYSDDENSPIRVRPPSRRDVIFSDNLNMPALSFHVATPELQYPEPVLNIPESNRPKKLLPINYPMDIQAARKEIIDVFTKSIQFLQDSDSVCSLCTHSSMPPLEEIVTATRTSEELTQIERDIFGDSDSSSKELYAEPHRTERPTQSWVLDPEMSSDMSSDKIVDDWDRIPVQEEEPNILSDDGLSTHSMDESLDESILESITQNAYQAILHSVSVFLETESTVIDVSQCKFKNGQSPELRNLIPVSADISTIAENPLPLKQLGLGSVDSPAQYLARAQPPAYLSTLPQFMQHHPFLRELKGLRRRISEVVNTIIYSLDTEDWGVVMEESLDVLVEHGDAFRELTICKKDYYREICKCENALIHEKEDDFLRSSASQFRALGRLDLHDSILDILQVRTRYPKVVQQLLTAGYLDSVGNDHTALHMLWIFKRTRYGQ